MIYGLEKWKAPPAMIEKLVCMEGEALRRKLEYLLMVCHDEELCLEMDVACWRMSRVKYQHITPSSEIGKNKTGARLLAFGGRGQHPRCVILLMSTMFSSEARAYPRSDTHCPRPGIVANMRGLPARGRSRPKKLILHRQQHPVRLATLNVGTLTGRSRELADNLRKRRVDICCVQETRWKGSKSKELGDGYKLIYHGTSNRNGVGIILNESFRNSVTAVDRLLDRLMIVKVDTGEVESRVVSAYAPQMGCSEEEKMCFWEDLLVHLLVMDLKISRPRKRHPRTETQRIKWWNLKDRKEIFLRPWLHLRFPTLLVVWRVYFQRYRLDRGEHSGKDDSRSSFPECSQRFTQPVRFCQRLQHYGCYPCCPYPSGETSREEPQCASCFSRSRESFRPCPRGLLWMSMRSHRVPEEYVRWTKLLYAKPTSVARCAAGTSRPFPVEVGVHQGSSLSPLLFILCMDTITKEIQKQHPWTLLFADDVMLPSESRGDLQKQVQS